MAEFKGLLHSYGIKSVSATVTNPRSNGVIERCASNNGGACYKPWPSLVKTDLEMCSMLWMQLLGQSSPPWPNDKTLNWNNIHQGKKKLLAASNTKEHKSRIEKHYSPGSKVLMNNPSKGPFTITKVHNNRAVDIDETINIHHLKPFHTFFHGGEWHAMTCNIHFK